MYNLLLTPHERKDIDWVNTSYPHGNSLRDLLMGCKNEYEKSKWWSHEEITFTIPESVAWEIVLIGEACEYRWHCFTPSLSLKLTNFCLSIV